MATLLDLDLIVTMARALDLVTEFDKSFHEARIVTDLRPLFEDPSDIQGAVIVHTLRIEYHQGGGQIKAFYVTLGASELHQLQSLVQRAVQKSDALRHFAEASKLRIYDVMKEDSA